MTASPGGEGVRADGAAYYAKINRYHWWRAGQSSRTSRTMSGRSWDAGADMKIPKPTAEDRARFESLVPPDARVEVKPMFGNLGAFVNGNMFMGLFGSDVGVKLDDTDHGKLSK